MFIFDVTFRRPSKSKFSICVNRNTKYVLVLIEFGFSSPSFSSTSSPSFIMTKQKIQKKNLKEKAKIVRENSRFFSSSINNTIFFFF